MIAIRRDLFFCVFCVAKQPKRGIPLKSCDRTDEPGVEEGCRFNEDENNPWI
jgi:hypothetical protein